MSVCVPAFLFSLPMSAALTPLVRWAAGKLGVVDHPDGFRKLQEGPVPRTGGVAIYVAFCVSLLVGSYLWNAERVARYPRGTELLVLVGCATAVLVVGLWDDIRGLSARRKFLLLAIVALVMYAGATG